MINAMMHFLFRDEVIAHGILSVKDQRDLQIFFVHICFADSKTAQKPDGNLATDDV